MFDFALNKKGRFDWFVAKLVDVLSSTEFSLSSTTVALQSCHMSTLLWLQ